MSVTGNTRHPGYRRLTLLYEFQKLKQWTRRQITPTDIDGRFLIHSGTNYNGRKGDFFLWLDLKTAGTVTSTAQRDAFDALLRRGRGYDAMIIAEHQLIQSVNIPTDITRFAIRAWDAVAKNVAQTEWFVGDDGRVGWWVENWFAHCEERRNHFITAFRQSAGIYPKSIRHDWRNDMDAAAISSRS